MPEPADDPLLTVREVAELLKLNQQTIRNWIARGELSEVRIGQRRVRVKRSDLDRWIGAHETATPPSNTPTERRRLSDALHQASVSVEGSPAELAAALRELAEAARDLARGLES